MHVLNGSVQRKRHKEQRGCKRFYSFSSHSQEIRQTKYGHKGNGLQWREIIAVIQFLCGISNRDMWINTSHYFPCFVIYRRGNKHLIAAQNSFHWNITLINANWHRVLICLFLIGNHSMQNLNEPVGSDHLPQARLSCFVFAAGGSSLIWVSVPLWDSFLVASQWSCPSLLTLLLDRRHSGDSDAVKFISLLWEISKQNLIYYRGFRWGCEIRTWFSYGLGTISSYVWHWGGVSAWILRW